MSADPGFLNYQAGGLGNYSAASASAYMVGKGISASTAASYNSGVSGILAGPVPTYDFNGKLRPTNGAWDIGPYQW